MKDEFDLIEYINEIVPADQGATSEARERQDSRVKVPRSLGRLEDISIKVSGITGKAFGNDVSSQAIVLMCADNGVVEAGVASAPQSVTLMQTINFTKRITGVGAQAAHFGIDILDIDIGVNLPIPGEFLTDQMLEPGGNSLSTKVVDRRIANGTRNFLIEPAMESGQTIRAIRTGIEAAQACKTAGKSLIGVGEMGIGNTTTASSIIAAIYAARENISDAKELSALLDRIVGRGGGLSDDGLERKKQVILEGLNKYRSSYIKSGGATDAIALLSALGGFDIAGMVGVYLGAAANRIPVVVDGVISIAAALIARELCPCVTDYMFTSHKSDEGGYRIASELLGIEPMYDLGMRLGEGSGCPIAFKIIEAACAVINDMWSLQDAEVESNYLNELMDQGYL